MTKSPSRALLAAAVLAAALGCGPKSPPVAPAPPPPLDDDLLALAPAEADVALWLDLAAIRSSALWEIVRILRDSQDMGLLRGGTGIDPLDKTDEILFAFQRSGPKSPDQLLVVLKGTFVSGEVISSYFEAKQGEAAEAVSEEVAGFKAVRTPRFVAVEITERTILLATDPMARRAADLARKKGRSLRERAEFGDLALDEAAARLRYRRGVAAPDFTQYGAPPPAIRVDDIFALDAALTLENGLTADISITTETQMEAASMTRKLEAKRSQLGESTFVVFLGLDWLLDRIEIANERNEIRIAVKMDDRDLEELGRFAARLKKIRELAESGQGPALGAPLSQDEEITP